MCLGTPLRDLCLGSSAIDGCSVGSLRGRAPVQGPAGIVGRPIGSRQSEEVPNEAELICGCRLGFTGASGVCDRCSRGGGWRAGVRAWRPGPPAMAERLLSAAGGEADAMGVAIEVPRTAGYARPPSTGLGWPPSTTRSAAASIWRYVRAATVMRAPCVRGPIGS